MKYKSSLFLLAMCVALAQRCVAEGRVEASRLAYERGTVLVPDPSVFADGGRYYLIGTENSLADANEKCCEAVFPMFVSDDLRSWRKAETGCVESRLLPRTNAFGKGQFWAPQIFRHQSRYYLAYTSDLHWGLAVADAVGGPYRAHAEFPRGGGRIDPFVFVDDDGRIWAYFSDWKVEGNSGVAVVELTKDLKAFVGEPTLCVKNDRPWERTPLEPKYVELNRKLGYKGWQAYQSNTVTAEGPTVLKRNGKYVLFYSANAFASPDYCVCAAVADAPQGPWKKLQEGSVLSRAETGFNGTGHGDVFFDASGAMWYVFHVHNSPMRIDRRRTGIVRLVETVGADGCPRYAADRASVRLLTAAAETSPIVSFLIPAGKPDADECRALVRTVNDAGFDQFLLYPSTGLEYEYLGEDFFGMVGSFVDEAERRGMRMWLYDEFNWPSGTARGRVPAENEKCLYRELVASTNAAGEMSWQVVVSREKNVDNYCLDTNNWEPASVRRFMELTHFQYEARFRGRMGPVIRGIFTDEPGHSSGAWRLKMPEGLVLRLPLWSGMEEEYRLASGGRDFRADAEAAIRSAAPADAEVFRLWTELRSKRYRRTYFDPIAAWCATNDIESTGHLLCEDFAPVCARVNGLPLNTLKGLTKPGIDLIRSATDRNFEWITLAFAQSASMANGKCGIAELFALGPCDLTFAIMRKLYWICALHRIDTYFQSLYHHRAYRFDVKDGYAMYSSPTQPWFKEMPILHETAKEAARWASKPFRCDIAVVYPQRAIGAFGVVGRGKRPPLEGLCRELTWNQFTYRLIEEDEGTDLPVVLDWEGESLVERRTGVCFADAAAAVAWLELRFAARPRVKDAAGRTRPGFITRAYLDGSAVAVDALTGEVVVSPSGDLRSVQSVRTFAPATFPAPTLSLSGPSKRRLWLNPSEKLTVTAPLEGVRFVLRHRPEDKALAVTLDGRPLAFPKPCASVAYAYDPLYAESEPLSLAAGEHVLELSGGPDDKLFLPVMWLVGDFMEKERGVLSPLARQVPFGSLAFVGLPSFAGTATYRTRASFAAGERMSVDSGGAVVRVRFGGRDLGARGWAPFAWEIPAELCGRDLPLEIDIVTSVRPIFGDERAPGAKLAHRLWTPPTLEVPPSAGLRAWSVVPPLGATAAGNRAAIQRAVDAASARGGGVVTIPAGEWPCGSVRLGSHVELRLEAGAVLKGSCDPRDYNADDAFEGNFLCRVEQWGGAHLLFAADAEDVAVTGEGMIDGSGPAFFGEADEDSRFPWYKYGLKRHPFDRTWYRPGIMLGFFRTKNVRLAGVTLRHPPSWTCHFRCCDGIDVRGVTIDADRAIANSDGFSVDCSRNARFADCTVKTGDDGFAIRASCELHAATNACENIRLENCEIWSCCYGVRLGVGTGTIRNVEIENCRICEAAHGFGFTPAYKLAPVKDVDIVGVRVRGCTVRDVCRPVDVWVKKGARAKVGDVVFEDCRFASLLPSCVSGAASVPVRDFVFRRCSRFTQFWIDRRSNREWLTRNGKEMRALSGAFLTTNAFAAVTAEDCTPRPAGTAGVLALAFAGRDFARWKRLAPTLARHNAHATFYIEGPIDASAEAIAKALVDEGHSVGLCRPDGVDEDREKCFFAYLPARTFAYPKGARTPESDRMLREKGFERTLELQSADAATLLSRVDQLAKDRATAVFEASRLTSGELDAVLLRCRAAGLDLLGLNELPLP